MSAAKQHSSSRANTLRKAGTPVGDMINDFAKTLPADKKAFLDKYINEYLGDDKIEALLRLNKETDLKAVKDDLFKDFGAIHTAAKYGPIIDIIANVSPELADFFKGFLKDFMGIDLDAFKKPKIEVKSGPAKPIKHVDLPKDEEKPKAEKLPEGTTIKESGISFDLNKPEDLEALGLKDRSLTLMKFEGGAFVENGNASYKSLKETLGDNIEINVVEDENGYTSFYELKGSNGSLYIPVLENENTTTLPHETISQIHKALETSAQPHSYKPDYSSDPTDPSFMGPPGQ